MNYLQTNCRYTEDYDRLVLAIDEVLWNEEEGVWLDFDLENGLARNHFCPSNLWPLFAECYNGNTDKAERAVDYLTRHNLDQFPGGVPTTLFKDGDQQVCIGEIKCLLFVFF